MSRRGRNPFARCLEVEAEAQAAAAQAAEEQKQKLFVVEKVEEVTRFREERNRRHREKLAAIIFKQILYFAEFISF